MIDANGRPVGGATINILGVEGAALPSALGYEGSDAEGRFDFTLVEGPTHVLRARRSLASFTGQRQLEPGDLVVTPRTGNVTGLRVVVRPGERP